MLVLITFNRGSFSVPDSVLSPGGQLLLPPRNRSRSEQMPPVYRLTTEAPSGVCLRLVTLVNHFTADTCQGWTRLWLDQLPGLYFLPCHMGTEMVIGEKEGRSRERVFVIAVAGGLEEANTARRP